MALIFYSQIILIHYFVPLLPLFLKLFGSSEQLKISFISSIYIIFLNFFQYFREILFLFLYRESEKDEYATQILFIKWSQKIDKISVKKHNEYIKFFETIRDLLIENLIEKRINLKERLELIGKYSNNFLVRNLSVPEKLFLYETKRVFDIHYFKTKKYNNRQYFN